MIGEILNGTFFRRKYKKTYKRISYYYPEGKNRYTKDAAIAYGIISKLYNRDYFLDTLYSLAEIDLDKVDIQINEKIDQDARREFYLEALQHIEGLLNYYKRDNLEGYNDQLNPGVFEILSVTLL